MPPGNKPYLSPCWPWWMSPCVTRLQWVNVHLHMRVEGRCTCCYVSERPRDTRSQGISSYDIGIYLPTQRWQHCQHALLTSGMTSHIVGMTGLVQGLAGSCGYAMQGTSCNASSGPPRTVKEVGSTVSSGLSGWRWCTHSSGSSSSRSSTCSWLYVLQCQQLTF